MKSFIYTSVKPLIYPRERPPRDPDATTARKRAFDRGERPLPGYSSPPPRRTGWENDEQ